MIPVRAGGVGRLISEGIRGLAPDWGLYEADGPGAASGLLRVRKPHWPEGTAIEIPASGVETDPGTQTTVQFHHRSRQLPFVSRKIPSARGQLASSGGEGSSYYAMWAQSEANPQCNRITRDHQAPPTWQSEAGAALIGSLPRYYYDDALQSDGLPGSFNRLLSHEGVVLGESTVAAMVSLYNADHSAIVGYLVREWTLGSETEISWLHLLTSTIGTIPTNNAQRRQGYLFYDRASATYTVACPQGLLLCTAANAPTPTCCNWAHSYGSIPPESSVSVAGGYAMTGAWSPYDAAFDSLSTHGAVDCYVRGMSAWVHVAQVQLGNKLTGCDYLEGCGDWDPFATVSGYGEGQENTRWPFLVASQEWLVWLTGTAGDRSTYKGLTAAKAGLLAIKALTGVTRVVEVYDAPLLKLLPFDEALADFEEQLTYQSSLHPDNWIPLAFPAFGYDGGGVNGWAGGHIAAGAVGAGTYHSPVPPGVYPDDETPGYWEGGDIPEADLGYGHWVNHWTYHPENLDPYKWVWGEDPVWVPGDLPSSNDGPGVVDAARITQYLDVYSGWDSDADPTVANQSQRLISPFPRGIVDKDSKIYEFVRHSQWQANDGVSWTPHTSYLEPGGFPWTYGGFTDYASTGLSSMTTRVYKRVRNVQGLYFYGSGTDRLILRQYNGSGLLATLDLTREFPYVDEAGKHRTVYQHPDVIDWIGAGDYLWVLAADWWAADDQRLSVILINKTSMLEVDRIDLSPGTGRLWLIETDIWGSGGRPQIWGGVDATGEPWAQVAAWWTGGTESVIQEVRYVSSALTKSTLASNAAQDATTQPSRLTAVANVAIEPGAQFWIDAGSQVKRLNS